MYGIGPIFWPKLFLLLGILALLIYFFNTIMRKYLKVEKTKLFSYNHVNEKHKKIDWIIRISFLIIILITYFFTISRIKENTRETIWYLETWFVMIMFIVISESVRAFMEWKYAVNRKAYIFTISQLIFILLLLWIVLTTNFINIF